jgi:Alcohol dehydrogenase, class IV
VPGSLAGESGLTLFKEEIMFSFCIPTEFVFGVNALKHVHELKLPGSKALIVITNGKSVRVNGYLAELEHQLTQSGISFSVFDGIGPNPTKDSIMAGAAQAKKEACDFVLALGGGSPMDSAKVIALMATNPGDLWDYCIRGTGKGMPIQHKPLPIVCITTTAGTGSEADNSGMVNNIETNEKYGIGHPSMFPTLSIVDPVLMTSVPPLQTAFQGLDTFYHLAEGYLSKKANLFNEMFSITGIENVGKYLVRSVKDGKDLEAREHMAFANTLGGLVMSTGKLLSQHSLEHILSAYHPNLPHGAGLILICRAYFAHFIHKGCCPDRFIRLAIALGKKDASKPEDFLEVLEKLLQNCGIADIKMSDYGITYEELEHLAVEARKVMAPLFENDPSLLTPEDCIQIYQASYS